uniref:TonB-dependent siderophore receptor n=1 Tax=Cellvibrio fontiphilus TaxID=1815559 RepID=UPI002B4BA8E2|nr:TonB-dependent receptor [Cellvibrio fontiphilus]
MLLTTRPVFAKRSFIALTSVISAPLFVISPVLLAAAPGQIEEVLVTSHQAYRGNVPSAELPQAIQVIDQSVFADRAINRFQDVLDYSTSISRQNDGGGLWDSFSLRGFPGNENMPSNYLINGFNAGRGFSGHRDTSNIEQVEILKGPGSALYGRSEPGGTINIITRKPEFTQEGYVKMTGGSFDQYRLEGDYTNGVSDKLALRINGAVQDFKSYRDYVESDKQVVTPSLKYLFDNNASLLYEAEYLKQDQLFDRGYVVLNNDFETVPRSRYLGEPGDGLTRISATGHQLTYQQTLANDWTFTSGIGYRESELNGFSSDAELARGRQSLYDGAGLLTRQRRYRDYDSEDLSVRAEVSGSLAMGSLTHNLMLGIDAYDYDLFTLLGRYRGAKGSYALDIYNPQYGVAQPGAVNPLYANKETQKAVGIYLQDQVELSNRWRALLGARLDDYEQKIHEQVANKFNAADDSRVSPRAGLVFLAAPWLNLYTSYSEGFVPQSGTDAYGTAFDPEESESIELGAKIFLQDWQITAAVFDAEKTNMLTTDPVNAGFSAALGKAGSTGFELDASGNITDNLSIILSYAYLDTRTLTDSVNIDWGVLVPEGSPLVNVPDHSLMLSLKQSFSIAQRDAAVGVRTRYISSRLGDTVNPNYRLPSYTLVSLFGDINITRDVSAELVVDNLFDEVYVYNSYSPLWTLPGEPRAVRASVKFEF